MCSQSLAGLLSNPFKLAVGSCEPVTTSGVGIKVTSCDATVTYIEYPNGCNGGPGPGFQPVVGACVQQGDVYFIWQCV